MKKLISYTLLFPFIFSGIGMLAVLAYFLDPDYKFRVVELVAGSVLGMIIWYFEMMTIRKWLDRSQEFHWRR